jgi:hypothetical protein
MLGVGRFAGTSVKDTKKFIVSGIEAVPPTHISAPSTRHDSRALWQDAINSGED